MISDYLAFFFVVAILLCFWAAIFCYAVQNSALLRKVLGFPFSSYLRAAFNFSYRLGIYRLGEFLIKPVVWLLQKCLKPGNNLVLLGLEVLCMLLNAQGKHNQAEKICRQMLDYYHSVPSRDLTMEQLRSYLITAEDYASLLEIKGDVFGSKLMLAEAADVAARHELNDAAERLARRVDLLSLEKPPDDNT